MGPLGLRSHRDDHKLMGTHPPEREQHAACDLWDSQGGDFHRVKRNPVLLFGKKTGTTVVIENSLGEPRTEFIMICTLRISLDPSRYVFIA